MGCGRIRLAPLLRLLLVLLAKGGDAALHGRLRLGPTRNSAAHPILLCAAPGDADVPHAPPQAALSEPPSTAAKGPSWDDVGVGLGPTETALVGIPLFFLIQSISIGSVSAVVPEELAPLLGRVIAFGLFAAIQAAAGLPLREWALRDQVAGADWKWLDGQLAPMGVFLPFAFLAFLPTALAQASGDAELVNALLPAGGAVPSPGRLVDVLVAAPLTEELFFRAWLIAAAQRAGAPPAITIGASAITFSVWHVGGEVDASGGLLTFGVLGAWLATAYMKGGQRLSTTVGAHMLWNAAMVAVRVFRS